MAVSLKCKSKGIYFIIHGIFRSNPVEVNITFRTSITIHKEIVILKKQTRTNIYNIEQSNVRPPSYNKIASNIKLREWTYS